MSRQNFNDGQEIIFNDLKKIGSHAEKTLFDRVIFELIQRAENAFFDDGLKVAFLSSTQVRVNNGLGFQTDATVAQQEPQKRLLFRAATVDLTIIPPDASLDRIDIVVIKHNRATSNTETRKFKDEITEVVSDQSLVTETDWQADLQIVAGVPDAAPVAPAIPAGFIKISEVTVTAVTGIAGAGAVTDERTILPVGGSLTVDTTGALRVTAGLAVPIQTLILEIDALLKNGKLDDNIFADSVTDPAAPTNAGEVKLYNKGSLLFIRAFGGVVTPVGAAGGGGGANWQGDALEADEFDEKVWKFAKGDTQELDLYLKVPQGYLSGREIEAFLSFYSPSTADEFKFQIVSSLVRKNLDAINSTTNQETKVSVDFTNTVANQMREANIKVTSPTGTINSVGVSPGDMIRLELTREAPGGTDDAADVRFIPSSTEVKFG